MTQQRDTTEAAGGSPVERGVRPHAIRLASQLQSAAYSHGYEDGHPSNATTRQDKYSAASQRLLSELREAIELLIAERDKARADLAQLFPLRERAVVDADDNMDCWDVRPYELASRHVAELNERDPAANWRVVELWARELVSNVEKQA